MGYFSTILGIPDPVCFRVGNFEVRWYAVLITLGLVFAFFIMQNRLKKAGEDPELIYDLLLWTVPLGVIGARLYYVAFMWEYYAHDLMEIFMVRHGGLAIHGAILGGALGVFLFCRQKHVDFWTVADVIAPALILGQALGRWGNYFNGEAYGMQTDSFFSIQVYENGQLINVVPTFLYESVCDMLIFFFLILYVDRHKKAQGEVFCWYAILYSLCRFFIEGMRTDSLLFFGLRIAQIVSIVGVVGGIVFLLFFRKRAKKSITTENPGSENNRQNQTKQKDT